MLARPLALLIALAFVSAANASDGAETHAWSERDLRILASLRRAPTPPPSPTNRVADDPRAAALGRRIFFDARFSASGEVACASCHDPVHHFTDGRARSVPGGRNAPTVVGAAFGSWFYWDGRRDSLWAQALVPFEASDEMRDSRIGVVRRIGSDAGYRVAYEAIFGAYPVALLDPALPERAGPLGDEPTRAAWEKIPRARRNEIDRVYANVGKAIEAYERTLVPADSRFDRYVDALRAGERERAGALLDARAVAGLRLFIDPARTQCMQCHNGPQLSNGGFHNIGTGALAGAPFDFGRALGVRAAMLDLFNCEGPHSDAPPADCRELRFLSRDTHVPLEGSFKTPTLRGAAATAPYFHDGRFATLRLVLDYYNDPPRDGDHELRALGLNGGELDALDQFLRALSGEVDAPAPAKTWSDSERTLLASLRLSALPAPPPDPGNRRGDDAAAAVLGAALFEDAALSKNGEVACQTCHDSARAFSDPRGRSTGLAPLRRNAPSLLDVGYVRWLHWDGRADSLWSQALLPLEHPEEMGASRSSVVRHVAATSRLVELYRAAFGTLPAPDADHATVTATFANVGKALAAYQRTLRSAPSRFDAYVDAVLAGQPPDPARTLDARELAGLQIFISGRTACLTCHHGPRFTDGRFHNIGTGELGGAGEDLGRAEGRERIRNSEFNCASPFNDPDPVRDCRHLDGAFANEVAGLVRGGFRTPGLRNLPVTAPYFHDGRFASLEEVLRYYRTPPDKSAVFHELPKQLDLSDDEIADLASFLRALAAD